MIWIGLLIFCIIFAALQDEARVPIFFVSYLLLGLIVILLGALYYSGHRDEHTHEIVRSQTESVTFITSLTQSDKFVIGKSINNREVWFRDSVGEYRSISSQEEAITFVRNDSIRPSMKITEVKYHVAPNGTWDKKLFFFSLIDSTEVKTRHLIEITIPSEVYWADSSTKQNLSY